MIGTLTIHRETEAAFKKRCAEFDIEYTCIKEGEHGDTWQVVFDDVSDIYALGQAVGTDALIEFHNNNK